MRMVIFFIYAILSINTFSGEGSHGGGPRVAGKHVEVSKDQISDIRLKDESIVSVKDFLKKNDLAGGDGGGGKIVFSKDMNVADIQLISGEIINFVKEE
ncbi:hypothetical protein OAT67_08155 [Bacteriovoracaceae bacterium]|nr:hypothetical protein [Bacteriovoracaceae bacterium]